MSHRLIKSNGNLWEPHFFLAMDADTENSNHKRKKYSKRYFLTTSKKCKRYRTSHRETTMEPNDLQLSTTSDSESETREVMLTEEAATSNQHPVYTTATIKKTRVLRCRTKRGVLVFKLCELTKIKQRKHLSQRCLFTL